MDVFKTLIGWVAAGLMDVRLVLRAPSGAFVAEFTSLTDVPRVATDPGTGAEFRVLPEQVEVWYRVVRADGAERNG